MKRTFSSLNKIGKRRADYDSICNSNPLIQLRVIRLLFQEKQEGILSRVSVISVWVDYVTSVCNENIRLNRILPLLTYR